MVRTHRQKRMTREFDYAEGMPLVALVLVAEIMGSGSLDFVEEVSRQNVGGGGEFDGARNDLCSMALVHRTWTRPAQAIIKRRVVLKSWMGARRFMHSPLCGPWTCELIFDPPWIEVEHSQDEDDEVPESFCRPTLKNPWPLVCKLLICMPNLRLLAISLLHRTNIQTLPLLDLTASRFFAEALGGLQSLEGLVIVRWRCTTSHRNAYSLRTSAKILPN